MRVNERKREREKMVRRRRRKGRERGSADGEFIVTRGALLYRRKNMGENNDAFISRSERTRKNRAIILYYDEKAYKTEASTISRL